MGKDNSTAAPGKIFVLDTSVILYDHDAFQNFQEHDVAIPIQVLEELDNFKTGNDTRNYEARSFIRLMDSISKSALLNEWIPLKGKGRGSFRVVMDDIPTKADAEKIFGEGKFDHACFSNLSKRPLTKPLESSVPNFLAISRYSLIVTLLGISGK